MRRVHVLISGRVQGVFFRANTRRKAMDLNIKGWIKNLSDERVEAVFEGEDEAVKEMVEFCKKGPFGAKITRTEVKEEKYTGEFTSFEIGY
ncbi:MAG: acylphosphatase [Nanoarchaeota archaeon]|nr:acylphosphatase [Nanoarchaeota archaeon]